MEPEHDKQGSRQQTFMEAWQMLNRRTKIVASSFAAVALLFVSWSQIGQAWAQLGLPVPATRAWVDDRLMKQNLQLRDVKRKILEGQIASYDASEERIVGEQVSLRLKIQEVTEPVARRIIENRLASIEIERNRLRDEKARVRDELTSLN